MLRDHRAGARLATLLVCLCCGLSTLPAAVAEPDTAARHRGDSQAFPSQDEVDLARARAARKAQDVSVIEARMLLADQRLQKASLAAEQASEAYNGAMWRLQQAKDAYRAAQVEAARARRTVATERNRIGALVAQSYQQGGDLSALNAMLSADGPEGVLDQYAAYHGASTSLQADYKRFTASDALARVFESQTRQAKATQVVMAARARQAQARAVAATEAAQREAAAIATQRNQLVRELARAQHISVRLAGARQTALEQRAHRREERARRAAAARSAAQAEAALAARPPDSSWPDHGTGGGGDSPSAPTPGPDPFAVPPPPSGGATQAIRFAMDQLGEPYRWGAAGPGSWDCSGLTMRAWAAAGRALPHYSVAQYSSGVPISVWQLLPGDLVFWSANGRPGGIHHVAMYIGEGQVIHAPRVGRPVEVVSMYYWVPPTFFLRV